MILSYIQLLRPLQWLKNIFVFAPIFFSSNLLKGDFFWPTLVVFASFCLISSSIYCFNDLQDVEADRLHPKKIVIVSSSPQIRYPDYYGIDMSKMSEFIAFKAAVELLKDRHLESLITEVYDKCKAQVGLPKEQMVNYVKEIYSPFTDKDISRKMVEMLKAPEVKSDIEIVYQTIDGLHKACPKHTGDWYFSGDYPTPGGVRMVNQAFINYVEQIYNKQK